MFENIIEQKQQVIQMLVEDINQLQALDSDLAAQTDEFEEQLELRGDLLVRDHTTPFERFTDSLWDAGYDTETIYQLYLKTKQGE